MAGNVSCVGVDTISTGHGCSATAGIAGLQQTSVKIAGSYVALKGDNIASHTILVDKICVPHSAVINNGAPRVKIGGISIARVSDSADAGSVQTGHAKVYCGD